MDDKSINNWDDDDLFGQTDMTTVDIVEAQIETYQKLTEIQPDDAKAHYELGEAYRDSINPLIAFTEDYGNETSDEIEAMKQSKHPKIRTVLEKARKAYRTAIAIKPYYAEAYSALGEVYHRIAQFDDAIQAFKQAIVLENKGRNNLARVYHRLGKQKFADGNYLRAIECYNNAIVTALKDDDNEMYYDLAVAYHDAGRYELAIWAYRRVRSTYNYPSDLFRRYPDLLYRLGAAYHKCSRFQDAVDAYQEAIYHQTAFEPLESPEWWDDVFKNKESATRHEPL